MNDIIVAMKDKAVYTLKEAADFLSISYSTIKRLARNAGLPVFKVGRQWRINPHYSQTVANLISL